MENYVMDPKRDARQREVICIDKGHHLVLASAGCGKTDILAERARRALCNGTNADDMLCLTFTNRAARGMRSRITEKTGKDGDAIFIGNIHRFCSRFIFEKGIVTQSSSIMDEDDSLSVVNSLTHYVEENEDKSPDVASLDFPAHKRLTALMQLQHLMTQYRFGHPKEVIIGNVSDYIGSTDTERFFSPQLFALLCREAGVPVSVASLVDIYDNSAAHLKSANFSFRTRRLLTLMEAAHKYEEYKTAHDLVDFDDLLVHTFTWLMTRRARGDEYKRYSWIQIDEVQDLNPLQFAIVDALTAPEHVTIYLGDEQQAIFSFIGAKLSKLGKLKERCAGNVHHLDKCYRSPKYLLDIFNDYARLELDTDPDLLPQPNNLEAPAYGDLKIFRARTSETAAACAASEAMTHTDGRTAILVPTNRDADTLSNKLEGKPHFKISGTDLFSLPQTRLLLSHLNVVWNDINHLAWARILWSLGMTERYADARELVMKLKEMSITPSDFLIYEDSTYVLEFLKAYATRPVVIFDTETTGLDVYADDIVQIAATRYERGKAVETLNILLHTDREIPPMLGDIVNPLVEEYASRGHLRRDDGLRKFIDFARGAVLIGHNVDYDYHILDNNCRRNLPEVDLHAAFSDVFDSLKLARLLFPALRSYKLKDLLLEFGLAGNNSHLADEDIEATYSLVEHCFAKASEDKEKIVSSVHDNAQMAKNFRDAYGSLYLEALSSLYRRRGAGEFPLVDELRKAAAVFFPEYMPMLEKFGYICSFLKNDVLDSEHSRSLYEELSSHIMDLNTYKEADICDSSVVTEKIFVATVHKAKGLEFENVIVYGCVDDVYPFFATKQDPDSRKEDARKLYVAISRAKRRLCLMVYDEKIVVSRKKQKYTFPAAVSPFLSRILSRHSFIEEREK